MILIKTFIGEAYNFKDAIINATDLVQAFLEKNNNITLLFINSHDRYETCSISCYTAFHSITITYTLSDNNKDH